jgi:hypothetical protein
MTDDHPTSTLFVDIYWRGQLLVTRVDRETLAAMRALQHEGLYFTAVPNPADHAQQPEPEESAA